jgi:hypothetical protein
MPSAAEVLSYFSMPHKVRLLTIGERFGMLTTIEHAVPVERSNGRLAASTTCRCDCGEVATFKNNWLLSGRRVSCGCKTYIHGDAHAGKRPAEYVAWRGMKARCESPNGKSYERYGGAGVRVCARWSASYTDFLADMGRKPSPSHSIDRIDTNGDYEPSNCRWADRTTQAQNRNITLCVDIGGEQVPLTKFCREKGLMAHYQAIRIRTKRGEPMSAILERFSHA